MLTEKELLDAIDECQNRLPKTFPTVEKLAALYTILDHIRTGGSFIPPMPESQELEPAKELVVGDYGESEFYLAIRGKEAAKVWLVFDELMEALKVFNPKLYDKTIERLTALEIG